MSKMVVQIEDIPEDVYNKIHIAVYNSLKTQLNNFGKYTVNFANGKRDVPKDREIYKVQLAAVRLYISKAKDDPLNVVYLITYRFRTATFNEIISSFLSDYDLLFDIDLLQDKNEFLNDISQGLKHILNLQNLKINHNYGYIELIASVIINAKSVTHIFP